MAATIISSTAWTSGNVTVPADCTAAYLFWGAGYEYEYLITPASNATLGGNSADSYSVSYGTAGYYCAGMVIWYNPPTGSQALSITFNHIPNYVVYVIAFVKDGDTTNYRDADRNIGYVSQSVTIDTNTTDLVLKFASISHVEDFPPAGTGWTSVITQNYNTNIYARLSQCDSPGASTTVCATEVTGNNYANIVAVSIIAGVAAATALPRRALDGPFYGSLRGSVR